MKFLLDANLPFSAKVAFPLSHEVFHVRDIGLERATDAAIFAWARKHCAVLVTRDLDFANIIQFPPRVSFGIIVLRLPSSYPAAEITRVLREFLTKADVETFPRSIVIVEEGRFRVRR